MKLLWNTAVPEPIYIFKAFYLFIQPNNLLQPYEPTIQLTYIMCFMLHYYVQKVKQQTYVRLCRHVSRLFPDD